MIKYQFIRENGHTNMASTEWIGACVKINFETFFSNLTCKALNLPFKPYYQEIRD